MHITWTWVHLVALFDVGSHALLGSSLSLFTCHPCTCASLLELTSLFFYFDLSFTVISFFFPLLHYKLHTELDNLITMQNLRNSANMGSDDAFDVHTFLTSSEPNDMVFSELNDSQGSFSYITQSSDLDIADTTHDNLAHRSLPRTCSLSISRPRLLWSIKQGNLMGENSSNAQIRTLLEEQRQMIIA